MADLAALAFSPSHIFYTLLLLLALAYWVTVFIGALDLNFLDFDTDTDADLHAPDAGLWLETLAFFNLGKVPFMLFFTFLALFLWTGSLLGAHFLGVFGWFFLIWYIPNLLIGLLLAKIATSPFKNAFPA